MTATKTLSLPAVIILGVLTWTSSIPAQQDQRPGTASSNLDQRTIVDQGTRAERARDDAARQVHYYGILGPVEHPHVYVSRDANLSVSRLVEVAGGFAATPNQFAQIIRRGQNGLRILHSASTADHLIPGDIVVFSSEDVVPRQADLVGVAFVGIFSDAPIVVSFPRQVATVRDVLAAMNQPETLLDAVRVVRTSRSHPRLPAGELPSKLVEGDVLVFDPAQIDREKLASAQKFPPPILIAESFAREQFSEITIRSASGDGPSAVVSEQPVTVEQPEVEVLTEPPAAVEPAVSQHPAAMPQTSPTREVIEGAAITHDDASSPVEAAREAEVELVSDSNLQVEDVEVSQVVPTGLVESPLQDAPGAASGDPLVMEARAESTPSTTPTVEPRRPAEFAGDSFDRLAMAPAESVGARSPTEATVPEPADATGAARGFFTRTTTLGLLVLLVAVVCFVGSVFWSRLDKSIVTGEVTAEEEQNVDRSVTPTARRRVLDRLIDNSLPLIEEPSALPEMVCYHGEAVGRRRLRIDAQQELQGPHAGTAPEQTIPVAGGERAASRSNSKSPVADESDQPADSAQPDTTGPDTKTTGGLLERVLLAMERERRR